MPETPDDVRRIAEAAVEAGYTALKLGWGPLGRDLALDEELVRAARETLGPDRALMLDGGRVYTVKRALELLRRVEEHRLYWFEEALQPDDLDGYRRLADARRRADRRRRGRRDVRSVPGARRAGSRRRPAAGHRALRRLHGGPSDRAARAVVGGRDRAALLLDRRSRRRVAPVRRDARPPDLVRVLRRRLAARQRHPAGAVRARARLPRRSRRARASVSSSTRTAIDRAHRSGRQQWRRSSSAASRSDSRTGRSPSTISSSASRTASS